MRQRDIRHATVCDSVTEYSSQISAQTNKPLVATVTFGGQKTLNIIITQNFTAVVILVSTYNLFRLQSYGDSLVCRHVA